MPILHLLGALLREQGMDDRGFTLFDRIAEHGIPVCFSHLQLFRWRQPVPVAQVIIRQLGLG